MPSPRQGIAAVVLGALALGTAVAGQGVAAGPQVAGGDVIRTWTGLALDTARKTNASDAGAARLYAMVDAAMYDAVNGIAGLAANREPAIVAPEPGTAGDPSVAAAVAAHDVLVSLYPDRAAGYDAQLASDVARGVSPALTAKGREWGQHVAAGVLAARTGDGSSPNVVAGGGSGPGQFPTAWSNTQYRALKPFAIADSAVYVGAPPPALTSSEYAADFDEVKLIGWKDTVDPGADATYSFWALGANTDQPPGAWLQVAQTVSAERDLSLAETARLFALESMALADTVAPTYETKFVYNMWRPTLAINQALSDGNDATMPLPGGAVWKSRAGSAGGTPQHWSGHSSFSWAAAQVLAEFFCTDAVPFTLDSDDAATGARSYSSFSAAAAEAGRSRVLGGLHFEFSNQAGAVAGRAVADEVLRTALRPVTGPDDGC